MEKKRIKYNESTEDIKKEKEIRKYQDLKDVRKEEEEQVWRSEATKQ